MNTSHLKSVPPEKGYYIAGFVDGEGSFFMSARMRSDYFSRVRFQLHFNVGNRDTAVLQVCKQYFRCGKIRESRPGFYTLEVENLKTLEKLIIPFFKKFRFLSDKKKSEFRIFQQAFLLLEKGIKTPEDLDRVLKLRAKLNEFRRTRITNTDEKIRAIYRFKNK